jgi:hypothetical protein
VSAVDASQEMVKRIVSGSGIVTPVQRRELARELQSHLDDLIGEARSSGCDEASIPEIVTERFGSPEEIAQAFCDAYRTERTAVYAAHYAALILVSLLTVATAISGIQMLVAIGSGASLSRVLRSIPWEAIGFVALTWGYTGVYLGERLFRKLPLLNAVALNASLFSVVAFALHYFLPGHVTVPAVAFACSGLSRVLQRIDVRFLWCLGTAGPLLLAWIVLGPLIGGIERLAPWEVGLMVWVGMTLSCFLMTSLTQWFDRRVTTLAGCSHLSIGLADRRAEARNRN